MNNQASRITQKQSETQPAVHFTPVRFLTSHSHHSPKKKGLQSCSQTKYYTYAIIK